MIPIPAWAKAWLVPAILVATAGLEQLAKLQPGWMWVSVVVGILVYIDGLLTVPGSAAQIAAHKEAGK